MAKLILNHISKDFGTGGRAAVNALSLDVREGGFLALLGPSGCGKTTVLRMIAGFEQPTDGSIHLGERLLADAVNMLPPERRNMAMVFQSYALWPHMNVSDNVGYPLKVRGISGERYREKVREALATVRLDDYAERRPAELSGGQRQRVALARCLVTSPDVVLLDEPLANLDRHLKKEMEETFREFHQRSGATMVYVTHDQSEAMALATDVAVMSKGRLLQVAQPAEIYARPEGKMVGSLVGQGAILSMAFPDGGPRRIDWPFFRGLWENRAGGSAGADVLVRPEDVVVDGEGISCRVDSVLYEGERYALRLSMSDGQVLRAYSREAVAVGDDYRVAVRSAWRL
ncbi:MULTISPECIES: ABC transporter ATP-binding protein [unclassified Rhizobium]|uniref:ABC transporter ATP-binding protein n=1 Tax=unclassified Rhizobium TaxID=2613769 RepID=UPI000DDE770A|nr:MULTISPECIES: ABC transporter ATP-binding protein [unclassified Rhizobium]MBB3285976.1 iron(III) transport system ATP-binding protein [Rhizobium sp. BK252]MBB3400862.1 iron(III) transport system ATP-binding protein [Rhizobium sp. BK289]MBB3413294.1 iron(III) transport system ATP-binding protein [Rhizobium sp. BK284]MBB3481328.1 iron(III) transport system ATP-binding protein [Rhizobium sp. BK347]MDK4723157.1 ABC transporter ATP-binding protein [Rhizobium sp. CNPSo 3968]